MYRLFRQNHISISLLDTYGFTVTLVMKWLVNFFQI